MEKKIKGKGPRLRNIELQLVRSNKELRGKIVDSLGTPVEGANVEVLSQKGGGNWQAETKSAQSDGVGEFVVQGVVPGTYSLSVFHRDFPVGKSNVKTGKTKRIILPFGRSLRVEVVAQLGGDGVGGASIIAKGPAGKKREGRSDNKGKIKFMLLTPGEWQILVKKRGFASYEKTITVLPGAHRNDTRDKTVQAEVVEGVDISGILRFSNGNVAAGVLVWAGGVKVKSGPFGRYELRDVPAGVIVVKAKNKEKMGQTTLRMRPGDEVVTADFELSSP